MAFFKLNYKLDNVYFYFAYIKNDTKQQKFFSKLRDLGYKIKTKEVKIIRQKDGTQMKKGNLDVELTIDVIKTMNNYSTAMLMSGDCDFCALIKYLQFEKKKVVVISSKDHVARELIQACDEYINFNGLRSEVER